jgi:hypothetical protein
VWGVSCCSPAFRQPRTWATRRGHGPTSGERAAQTSSQSLPIAGDPCLKQSFSRPLGHVTLTFETASPYPRKYGIPTTEVMDLRSRRQGFQPFFPRDHPRPAQSGIRSRRGSNECPKFGWGRRIPPPVQCCPCGSLSGLSARRGSYTRSAVCRTGARRAGSNRGLDLYRICSPRTARQTGPRSIAWAGS